MLKHLFTALGVALLAYMAIPAYATVGCTDGGDCSVEESGGYQPATSPRPSSRAEVPNRDAPTTNLWITTGTKPK